MTGEEEKICALQDRVEKLADELDLTKRDAFEVTVKQMDVLQELTTLVTNLDARIGKLEEA